jgi:polyisoprenoid-binding protein YceI
MIQRIVAGLMFVLFLAACGDSPQSAATVPTATSTVAAPTEAPTIAPTEVPTTAPTEVPTTPPTEAAAATAPTEAAATEPTEMPAVAPAADAATTAPTEAAQTDAASTAQRYLIVPTESEVRYEVAETFLRDNRLATAIGVTQEIEGAITVDPENPQNSTIGVITIDISAFTSDEDRRDQAIRDRWLESATYPIATFEPTEITGLPETYTEGDELSFQVTGDMTVRETTNPVTFDVTAQVMDGELVGTATTDIKMTDFGFDPPDIAGILRAEDDVRLIFDFVARPEA